MSSKHSREVSIVDSGHITLIQVEQFRCMGVTLSDRGKSEKSVSARVNAIWNVVVVLTVS